MKKVILLSLVLVMTLCSCSQNDTVTYGTDEVTDKYSGSLNDYSNFDPVNFMTSDDRWVSGEITQLERHSSYTTAYFTLKSYLNKSTYGKLKIKLNHSEWSVIKNKRVGDTIRIKVSSNGKIIDIG